MRLHTPGTWDVQSHSQVRLDRKQLHLGKMLSRPWGLHKRDTGDRNPMQRGLGQASSGVASNTRKVKTPSSGQGTEGAASDISDEPVPAHTHTHTHAYFPRHILPTLSTALSLLSFLLLLSWGGDFCEHPMNVPGTFRTVCHMDFVIVPSISGNSRIVMEE